MLAPADIGGTYDTSKIKDLLQPKKHRTDYVRRPRTKYYQRAMKGDFMETECRELMSLDFKDNPVTVIMKDTEPWWVAKEACDILGIKRTQVRRLDEDEKGVHLMHTPGGMQECRTINEPGLYSLIVRSRKPQAKAFKRWIVHEVLPSIRKTGCYLTLQYTNWCTFVWSVCQYIHCGNKPRQTAPQLVYQPFLLTLYPNDKMPNILIFLYFPLASPAR
jgi:prophage antirepressor-like protein